MEAGHRGHCESGTMILLCLTALALFVNLNCLNTLVSNLQLEEFKCCLQDGDMKISQPVTCQNEISENDVHFLFTF